MDARNHAKRFSAQLAAKHPTAGNLNERLWNFRGLGQRDIRNAAASTAASADLVIFSMSGIKPLPARVENWIEMWIWLIDGRKPALVALFATHHPERARVRAYLRKAAVGEGLAFFPHTNCAGTHLNHEEVRPAREQGGVNRVAVGSKQLPEAVAA